MVRPRLDATLLKVVYVDELAGTLIVRVVPDLRVTKLDADVTRDEPILRVKSASKVHPEKQLLIIVTAVLFSNSPDGMDAREVQLPKQPLKVVTAVLLSNSPDGMDAREVQSAKQY